MNSPFAGSLLSPLNQGGGIWGPWQDMHPQELGASHWLHSTVIKCKWIMNHLLHSEVNSDLFCFADIQWQIVIVTPDDELVNFFSLWFILTHISMNAASHRSHCRNILFTGIFLTHLFCSQQCLIIGHLLRRNGEQYSGKEISVWPPPQRHIRCCIRFSCSSYWMSTEPPSWSTQSLQ